MDLWCGGTDGGSFPSQTSAQTHSVLLTGADEVVDGGTEQPLDGWDSVTQHLFVWNTPC